MLFDKLADTLRNMEWRLWDLGLIRQYEEETIFQDDTQSFDESPGKLWSDNRESENETSFTSSNAVDSLEEIFGKRGMRTINQQLSMVIKELSIREDKAWLKREWKLVALTLDKLFFYTFSGVYLTAIISCGIRLTQIE